MRYYKRLNLYKAHAVVFDPQTSIAISWGWWYFVRPIAGKLVFNAYRYSQSTNQHQRKVAKLLESLGIAIDVSIDCPAGLQEANWADSTIRYYRSKIASLQEAIDKPRSHMRVNCKRQDEIEHLEDAIEIVEELATKANKQAA